MSGEGLLVGPENVSSPPEIYTAEQALALFFETPEGVILVRQYGDEEIRNEVKIFSELQVTSQLDALRKMIRADQIVLAFAMLIGVCVNPSELPSGSDLRADRKSYTGEEAQEVLKGILGRVVYSNSVESKHIKGLYSRVWATVSTVTPNEIVLESPVKQDSWRVSPSAPSHRRRPANFGELGSGWPGGRFVPTKVKRSIQVLCTDGCMWFGEMVSVENPNAQEFNRFTCPRASGSIAGGKVRQRRVRNYDAVMRVLRRIQE